MNQNIKNKLTIIIVTLAFISPFVVSWYLLNFTDFIREGDKSNNGDMISPPRQLDQLALRVPGEQDASYGLTEKWNLFYITDKCEQTCVDNLYRMHQIHLAMDKHSLRVQRVLFVTDPDQSRLDPILIKYPRQRIVINDGIDISSLIDNFKLTDDDKPPKANRLYIVDPLGQLMMSYPPDIKPRGIMNDLKKLLKASRIG